MAIEKTVSPAGVNLPVQQQKNHSIRNFVRKTALFVELALVAVTINACQKQKPVIVVDREFAQGDTVLVDSIGGDALVVRSIYAGSLSGVYLRMGKDYYYRFDIDSGKSRPIGMGGVKYTVENAGVHEGAIFDDLKVRPDPTTVRLVVSK